MNIVQAKVTRNRSIRAIPITGNYLLRDENTGIYRWAEPNTSWTLFSNTGGNRQIIANIRRDDTPHSPDLFLYSNLGKGEPGNAEQLMEQNSVQLDRTRNWYLRQVTPIDRTGIARFTGLPLNVFWEWWRKPLMMDHFQVYGLNGGQCKFYISNDHLVGGNLVGGSGIFVTKFNVFLKWEVLQSDFKHTKEFMRFDSRNQYRCSEKVMPWLRSHCQHGIIPFSDYDRMFVDETEEVMFTADVA